MCGVIGILSGGEPVTEAPLRRALAAMRHRGPDGEGVWLSEDRTTGLGHTRLTVIDLETGAQPLANEVGTVHAVVNGEFYDHERLRRDLEGRGHGFRTRTDSEVLIHLYEEHGVGCLEHLRGEFAFVIWDERRRLLFAARDRFGIKPLCYSAQGDRLLLASEAKGLFAAGVPTAWDREAFFQAAALQYVPADRTLFAGVRQLKPGHYLLADSRGVRTVRYWDLDYAKDRRDGRAPEAVLVEELRRRLDEAVRLRLRADVPVACHLSGGLDSSAVLALATQHSRRPVDCFTVSFSFEREPYDELRIAEAMAARAGATLHAVRVSPGDLVSCLPDAVYHSEGLAINGHLPAKFLLHRAVREAGYKVVLTGEGSDEVLAGYAHLRRDLMLANEVAPEALEQLDAGNTVSAGIMLPHGESLPLEAVRRALGFVPSFLQAKGTYGLRMRAVLSDDFLAEFESRDCCETLMRDTDVSGQLAGRHPVDQSLYLWNKSALPNYILRTLGDGTEMAHSVEGRLPFLDHHLFEFARELPLSLLIREEAGFGPVEKYALREAVRPLVTEEVYRRQKHPFLAPPLTYSDSPALGALLQDVLSSDCPAFFDSGKVRAWLIRLADLPPDQRAAADPVLMTVLTACLLHRAYRPWYP